MSMTETGLMNYHDITKFCKELAVKAGNAIIRIYESGFDVEYKQDSSPLTAADKAANEIIISDLRGRYPNAAILSEESKDDKSRLDNDYCFIVDPLDGTKEFIKRNGQFTVNIALAYMGRAVAGVIYVPFTKELYFAFEGGGAYYQTAKGVQTPIHVTDKLDKLIFVGSKSHSGEKEAELLKKHREKIIETVSAGSSLKGCMVASGQADLYYRFGYTCEWDTAAMQCIVEQAGGIFYQMDGTEMHYNRENNLNDKGFFAVNRKENIWI